MKKLFATMCLSLILSAITHVSFAHERGKEIKTEQSLSVSEDSYNISVVDYSTNIVDSATNVVDGAKTTYTNEVYGSINNLNGMSKLDYGLHRIRETSFLTIPIKDLYRIRLCSTNTTCSLQSFNRGYKLIDWRNNRNC